MSKKSQNIQKCQYCNQIFVIDYNHRKYCSKKCREDRNEEVMLPHKKKYYEEHKEEIRAKHIARSQELYDNIMTNPSKVLEKIEPLDQKLIDKKNHVLYRRGHLKKKFERFCKRCFRKYYISRKQLAFKRSRTLCLLCRKEDHQAYNKEYQKNYREKNANKR